MIKNGLEKPYLLFAKDMVYPERHIISGRKQNKYTMTKG
jgi:hypothetical protein